MHIRAVTDAPERPSVSPAPSADRNVGAGPEPFLAYARTAFTHEGCRRLLAPVPGAETETDHPLHRTARIALDWLAGEGKRLRPGLTLAAWASGTEEGSTDPVPESLLRIALAVEALHKASLIHDDIEDGDTERYGQPTVHALHGVPMAINAGDYLLGLGYRLVAGEADALGAERTGGISLRLAQAQLALSAGQGAELAWWRQPPERRMSVEDALAVYAGKTAPAFEAAIAAGRLAAGAAVPDAELAAWSRAAGIAYQIRDDLEEWTGAPGTERAGDARAGRPTVLDCLARESGEPDRLRTTDPEHPGALRTAYERTGTFDRARRLAETFCQQAHETAANARPAAFGRLLSRLTDLILPA